MKKTLIIVLDGTSVEYLSEKNTPNIYRMGRDGFMKTIKSQMPSVTNTNHASILSGTRPDQHKVVGNYYYNRKTEEHGFIESPIFMKEKTLVDFYKEAGLSTAFLSVKGKVGKIYGNNADLIINMEDYDQAIFNELGLEEVPAVDSMTTYEWIFNACYQVIKQKNSDFVYCTTNDYLMHNYVPESPEALEIMSQLDKFIGLIYDIDHDREIYITADHGMNNKDHVYDLQNILDKQGYDTFCLLPLKDRYISNHPYQEGGTVYVYVKNQSQFDRIREFLQSQPYIKDVYTSEQAEKILHLPKEQLGDLLILANENIAFGELENKEEYKNETVRTHGSTYETVIPLIAVNAPVGPEKYEENIDIFKNMALANQEMFSSATHLVKHK
ncbi:type I phosphodiesterase/nucleotide pyrophosphatase [Peptoniphilus sp. ING2-D1G]|nr:type I phosphodiesterase/nucleotide pyrophosphatase [Peptoniphilus sp. ING2-D1G]